MKLKRVTRADLGVVEGKVSELPALGLSLEFDRIEPSITGAALYERLVHKWKLGYAGDAEKWVANMNGAIDHWNANDSQIKTADDIARVFGI